MCVRAGLIVLLAVSAAVVPAAAQSCESEWVGDPPVLRSEALNDLIPEIRLRCLGAAGGRVKVSIFFDGRFTNASADIGGREVTTATEAANPVTVSIR